MAVRNIPIDLLRAAKEFLERKYIVRGNYITSDKDDLAREIATFVMQWEKRPRE